MKIMFCGQTFSKAPEMLREMLPDDEIVACPGAEVKDRGLTADVLIPLMHVLEPELIQGTSAKLIHQWGVGLEGVDIPAATARGIRVCNVPGDVTANADCTAEHALFLMMGCSRRIHECFRAFNRGEWGVPAGESLVGKSALIVGFGRVGKALASRLKAMGMNVSAIRRTPDPTAERDLGLSEAGAPSDLLNMAARADFVISTASVNPESRGLFGKELFQAMKPEAMVINVSRGPVVNEAELIAALRQGEIAAAGLDVFAVEPLDPNSPLLSMINVFATPHVAGATLENYAGVAEAVKTNINLFREGKPLMYCANPDCQAS